MLAPSDGRIRSFLGFLIVVMLVVSIVWLAAAWLYLPTEQQYEPLLATLTAIALIVKFIVGPRADPVVDGLSQRRLMLAIMRHRTNDALHQSLYQAARIELTFEVRPDLVENSLGRHTPTPPDSARSRPPGSTINTIFDKHAFTLLILGEPGSGKTTLLWELALHLLDRADQDQNHLMPVYFDLSSWSVRRDALADWLVEYLHSSYKIPVTLAQHWVNTDQILPLLDGLDEVAPEHMRTCVERINEFRAQHFLPMAVRSGIKEYQRLGTRLRLSGAILIQPLTFQQITACINRAGTSLNEIRRFVKSDPQLVSFLTPLVLGIAFEAELGAELRLLSALRTAEERRNRLFSMYVQAMLKKEKTIDARSQIVRWLGWLAEAMTRERQTVFHLEDIRTHWLPKGSQENVKRLIALTTASVVVLPVFFTRPIGTGLFAGPVLGLLLYLNVTRRGQRACRLFGINFMFGEFINHRSADRLRWSWAMVRTALPYLVRVLVPRLVLIMALPLAVRAGIAWGVSAGLLVFVIVTGIMCFFKLALVALVPVEEIRHSVPNQGLHNSAWNSILIMLLMGFPAGLLAGLFRGALDSMSNGILFGLAFGWILGFIVALGRGAFFCIQHLVLRIIIWRCGFAPLKYVHFLDHATERILLRKVGGGYRFVHRSLQEYFAQQCQPTRS